MFNARNVIIVSVAVAVVSLLGACLSLLAPPDSGGMGRDTYGTRGDGHRALFELLTELNVPTERLLVPPTLALANDRTLVFWEADAALVQVEPVYLRGVAEWVRGGGRVVATPESGVGRQQSMAAQAAELNLETTSLLGELHLPGVSTAKIQVIASPPAASSAAPPAGGDFAPFRKFWEQLGAASTGPPVGVPATAEGTLQPLAGLVDTLAVPGANLQVFDTFESEPQGRLFVRTADGAEHTLVLCYAAGRGEVVVVADPALFRNRFIAREDNAILAVHLLAGRAGGVAFDEFYHGLTIRGNPLWLATRRPYAGILIALLVCAGVWIWRWGVWLGPPLAERPVSRRSLAEYVDAMARFFQRGHSPYRFLLQEVRAGVLWTLRNELGLHPGKEHVESVTAALARRDPQRAEAVRTALAAADQLLQSHAALRERETLQALRGMTACL